MRTSDGRSSTGHFDNSHSRWVARLKVVLPLTALAILSTLFLVADRRDTGSAIPYSDVEIDRILDEGRIANPSYSGVGSDGAAVSLTASAAWPRTEAGTETRASTVIGSWEAPSGAIVNLRSDSATLIDRDTRAILQGGVSVKDAQGYDLASETLEVDLSGAGVVSPGPVTAIGPPGRIEAGAMALDTQDGQAVLTFTQGVRVLYDPTSPAGASE